MSVSEEKNNIPAEKSSDGIAEVPANKKSQKDVPASKTTGKYKFIFFMKIFVPLMFVVVCMLAVMFMTQSAIKNNNYIDGRFVLSGVDSTTYIEMESDGKYSMVSPQLTQTGKWELDGKTLTFIPKNGSPIPGRFVDRSYIVMKDENFLSGEIGDGEVLESEVVSSDGISYGFSTDGKFYKKEDGRYVEIGSYIVDGCFIVITTDSGSVTYLNCKDGITASYYQAS